MSRISIKSIIEDTENMWNQPVYSSTSKDSESSRYNYGSTNKRTDSSIPALISSIDRAVLSQFKDGNIGEQGFRKTYLNIVSYLKDVVYKNVEILVSDIKFVPTQINGNSNIENIIIKRQFEFFVKDTGFDLRLSEWQDKNLTYGSLFVKKMKNTPVMLDIHSVFANPNLETIEEGLDAGYCFGINYKYSYKDMILKDNWYGIKNLEYFKGVRNVKEVYFYIPKEYLYQLKRDKEIKDFDTNNIKNNENYKLVFCIVAEKPLKNKKGGNELQLLFIEEIDKFPIHHTKYEDVPNRLIGRGVIEKNIEVQYIKNMIINYRIKSMQNSSVNLYQTDSQDEIVKSLVAGIEDNTIIENGGHRIERIDNGTRSQYDYDSVDKSITENGNQSVFAFEVETGQNLPSGTPFRLGALLKESSSSYFKKKKQRFSYFLKNVIMDDLYEQFIRNLPKDLDVITDKDGGYIEVINYVKQVKINEYYKNILLKGDVEDIYNIPPIEQLEPLILSSLKKDNNIFMTNIKKSLKNIKYDINIVITDGDLGFLDTANLKDLYATFLQVGDVENAKKLANKVFDSLGLHYDYNSTINTQPEQLNPQVRTGIQGQSLAV